MASTGVILRMPSDIIAYILSHSETIKDLNVTIRSHSIFLHAFREGPYAIVSAIINSQIPSDAAPLLRALLESSHINHRDNINKSREVLDHLTSAISSPSQATSHYLPNLSLSELAFCSHNYAAAESLARSLAAEVKPIAIQTFQFGCPTSPLLTSAERTRLVRAFLRYQLMCSLFCPPDSACPSTEDDDGAFENKLRFFSMYSPWVNEHLMCAFTWLQRILPQAFDELAWHDVEWGELPVDNDIEPDENPRLQGFLSRGLRFLSDIACTDSYASWACLLQLNGYQSRDPERDPSQQLYYRFPDQRLVQIIGLADIDKPLEDWTPEQLSILQQGDGLEDLMQSSSCLLWLGANARRSIFGEPVDEQAESDDTNLWQLGYNVWDWGFENDAPSISMIEKSCSKVRFMLPPFKQGTKFDKEAILQSRRQRSEIWLAGGRGYWPMNGSIDFSGIQGLGTEKMSQLRRKWESEMERQVI